MYFLVGGGLSFLGRVKVLFEQNLMNNTVFLFDLTQILISKNFEKEIVFESSVLAWIRIRMKSIRIRNPA
jgi:hypothetical protein